MWTEITKDLVSRVAMRKMGYPYEETQWFYYIMEYLSYVSFFPSSFSSSLPCLPSLLFPGIGC